jgi:hypothetical protein
MNIVNIADLIDDNGKTIRENNLEKIHNVPLGTLVDVHFRVDYSGGAFQIIKGKMYVVSHDRDCDGTPLYSLCCYNISDELNAPGDIVDYLNIRIHKDMYRMLMGVVNGMSEPFCWGKEYLFDESM